MRRELTILNERGDQLRFADVTYELEPPEGSEANDPQLRAPMSGKVIAVRCEPGQRVSRGDTLVILEAMKLEHQLTASRDGVARELCVALGDQVSAQQILIELDEPDQDDS